MSIISWGKPKIEYALVTAGTPGTWKEFSTPKENSTALSTEKGDKKEATEEGGGQVDVKYNKSKYKLTFVLFAKKGEAKPIEDSDGRILGEYAVRLTPEDKTVEGFILDKTNASVLEMFTSEDGTTWEYTFEGLVPDDKSNILKSYLAP